MELKACLFLISAQQQVEICTSISKVITVSPSADVTVTIDLRSPVLPVSVVDCGCVFIPAHSHTITANKSLTITRPRALNAKCDDKQGDRVPCASFAMTSCKDRSCMDSFPLVDFDEFVEDTVYERFRLRLLSRGNRIDVRLQAVYHVQCKSC